MNSGGGLPPPSAAASSASSSLAAAAAVVAVAPPGVGGVPGGAAAAAAAAAGVKLKYCRYYAKDKTCFYGEECQFLHEDPAAGAAPGLGLHSNSVPLALAGAPAAGFPPGAVPAGGAGPPAGPKKPDLGGPGPGAGGGGGGNSGVLDGPRLASECGPGAGGFGAAGAGGAEAWPAGSPSPFSFRLPKRSERPTPGAWGLLPSSCLPSPQLLARPGGEGRPAPRERGAVEFWGGGGVGGGGEDGGWAAACGRWGCRFRGVWKGAGFAGTCECVCARAPGRAEGSPGGCVPVGAGSAASRSGLEERKKFFFLLFSFFCVCVCKASGREVFQAGNAF